MIRGILSTLVGLFVAFAVIAAMDWINHKLYPPSAAIAAAAAQQDFSALRVAVKDWLTTAPQMALILIPIGWVAGAFWGALVAAWISRPRSLPPALVVGALVVLATIANLLMIPHPAWIAVAGLAGIPLASVTAWSLLPRSQIPSGPQPYDMRKKNMAC